jgi:ABC-type transport system involved in cytochrome c biogenesis permease subunit
MADAPQAAAPVKAKVRATNDIYTSILALAVFCLVATIAFVCIYSMKAYGTFWAVAPKPS